MSELYIDKTDESTPPLSTPTTAEESNECVKEHVFCVYNRASFGQDIDRCPACDGLYCEIDDDVLYTMHDDYDEVEHDVACNLTCYARQKYGWMPHNAGFGFLDLAPSILHSNWFWDYIS
jgi:hypothetical protein